MKPNFALDFRNSAVTLLHRSANGWHEVGSVALDTPDLTEAMGYLRSTALGLAPRGLSAKLIIPNDQILYTKVVAPGPDAASRRTQILKALEGRTPYPVEDLVFDWWGNGPEVQVAVLARETLEEAETFAVEHRMNPVSFVAVPDSRTFRGEPWFGPTSLASTLLAQNEKVERDQDPVNIVSRSLPVEQAKQASKRQNKPVAADEAVTIAPSVELASLADAEPDTAAPLDAEAETPAVLDTEALPKPVVTGEPATTEPTAPEIAEPPVAHPIEPVLQEVIPPSDIKPVEPVSVKAAEAATIAAPSLPPEGDEAPIALDVPQEDLPEPQEPTIPPLQTHLNDTDDLPPMPSEAARLAFASRRSLDTIKPPAPSVVAKSGVPTPSTGDADKAISAKPNTDIPSDVAPPTLRATPATPTVERPFGARPLPIGPARTAKTPVDDDKIGKGLRGLTATVTAPGIAGSKSNQTVRPSQQNTARDTTIVPAKKPEALRRKPAPQRGKPRYLGLILTGLLLLALALIAAWSTYSLAFLQSAPSATETASINDTSAPVLAPADIPAPEEEAAADLQDQTTATASDGAQLATSPIETQPAAETLSENAPATGAETQPGPSAAPATEAQDEIVIATMDPPPVAPDPLALPQPESTSDALPQQQAAPPAFGTVYQFDAAGMIVPTKEGIVTPEGVRLVAGKPPVLPPERPAGLVTSVEPGATTPNAAALDPLASAAATADAPFPSDPALAKFRPKARPTGLAPPAQQQGDASSPLLDGTQIASILPKPRPTAILAAGEAARQAAAQASLASQAAVATTAPDPTASKLAVAISRKPEQRPRDLSRSVEAAVAAAVQTPEPTVNAPANNDTSGGLADSEPEITTSNPRIPTKASVAKQATYANVLNLSKINLIGVYGSQSNRYALVRQANGRYKKVKIGDSLDGGRVAAITDTEVRYQKGSKMITLALPKG